MSQYDRSESVRDREEMRIGLSLYSNAQKRTHTHKQHVTWWPCSCHTEHDTVTQWRCINHLKLCYCQCVRVLWFSQNCIFLETTKLHQRTKWVHIIDTFMHTKAHIQKNVLYMYGAAAISLITFWTSQCLLYDSLPTYMIAIFIRQNCVCTVCTLVELLTSHLFIS